MGVSHNMYTSFGMPSAFTYGFALTSNQMNMDMLCPELMAMKDTDKLKHPEGNIVTLDSTILQNNYFLADEKSLDESDLDLDDN